MNNGQSINIIWLWNCNCIFKYKIYKYPSVYYKGNIYYTLYMNHYSWFVNYFYTNLSEIISKQGQKTIRFTVHGIWQEIVVKNDMACGSTIGPIMSAKLGIPTVDIGGPQLSMHSIREMCCTSSVLQTSKLLKVRKEVPSL